jgi:hypothetical protein
MIRNGREIIRAGYAAGVKVADIARQCDSTPGSVRVVAKKMGIRHRRCLSSRVPDHLRSDWVNMVRRKKLSAHRVAEMLGLEAAGL